jgi:DNA-binding transcriptional LysR family regulator
MRKDLDYGLLHAMNAFVHVMDAGSFTAAAGQMGMTKAQISRLVSMLENRLQTKLLHRTTRRISATSVGESYCEQCKVILDLVA